MEDTKELTVNYEPQTRQVRFIKVATAKRVNGADLAAVDKSESVLYEYRENAKERTAK